MAPAPFVAFDSDIALAMALLAGMIAVAALGVAIGALARLGGLQREIGLLRQRLMQSRPTPPHTTAPLNAPPQQPPQPPDESAAPDVPAQSVPSSPHDKRVALTRVLQPDHAPAPAPPLPSAPAEPDQPSIAPAKPTPAHEQHPPTAPRHEPTSARATAGKPEAAPRSFEELMGTKLFIWIGGIALAAAAVFLLKWSFDRDMITPGVRVLSGAFFGLLLIAVAHWPRLKNPIISQSLCGAGLAALYAVTFAASNLYQFIGPTTGFFLTIGLTAAAIGLSLRHGVFTAGLGLIGGFVMPVLLEPEPTFGGGFFGYLLLLQGALVVVARRRQWFGLSIATFVAAGIWALLAVTRLIEVTHDAWTEMLLLGSAVVFITSSLASASDDTFAQVTRRVLAIAAGCGTALLLALHVGLAGFEPRGMWMLGVLSVAALALARIDRRFMPLPWVALGASTMLLLSWGINVEPHPGPFVEDAHHPHRYAITLAAFAAVFVLGGFACVWRCPRPVAFAAISSLAGLLLTPLAVVVLWSSEDDPWWLVPAGMTLLYAALTAGRYRMIDGLGGHDTSAIMAAMTSTAFAAFAVGLGLYDQPPWMGIGWAALVALTAWLSRPIDMPALRYATGGMTALAFISLLFAPGPFFEVAGATLIFNELLLGYGVSALLFGLTAWLLGRYDSTRLSEAMSVVTVLCVFAGLTWIIRHAFLPNQPMEPFKMIEAGTLAVGYMVLAMICHELGRVWQHLALRQVALVLVLLGLAATVLGPLLMLNPLWHDEAVGGLIVLNWLAFLYLLPAALASLAAMRAGHDSDADLRAAGQVVSTIVGIAALLLIFTWVSLSVRQGFAGSWLASAQTPYTKPEQYTYSMAWLALGVVLLVAGVMTASRTLRFSSLAVMLLTMVKVFIFDAAGLEDLWRVLSFLVLGGSLIGLGWVYQRYVFGPRKADIARDADDARDVGVAPHIDNTP